MNVESWMWVHLIIFRRNRSRIECSQSSDCLSFVVSYTFAVMLCHENFAGTAQIHGNRSDSKIPTKRNLIWAKSWNSAPALAASRIFVCSASACFCASAKWRKQNCFFFKITQRKSCAGMFSAVFQEIWRIGIFTSKQYVGSVCWTTDAPELSLPFHWVWFCFCCLFFSDFQRIAAA